MGIKREHLDFTFGVEPDRALDYVGRNVFDDRGVDVFRIRE